MNNALFKEGMSRLMQLPIQKGEAKPMVLAPKKGGTKQLGDDTMRQFLNALRAVGSKNGPALDAGPRLDTGLSLPDSRSLKDSDEWDEVEVTIQPGQSFGQMLIDSGLATDHGLWGSDGDVAYYEQQLRDAGAIKDAGNISAGQKLRIKRRR